jgi:hypothetical protein
LFACLFVCLLVCLFVCLFAIESIAAFESTLIAQSGKLLLWLFIQFVAIFIPYNSA